MHGVADRMMRQVGDPNGMNPVGTSGHFSAEMISFRFFSVPFVSTAALQYHHTYADGHSPDYRPKYEIGRKLILA